MKETLGQEALKALKETFGDRIQPVHENEPDPGGAVASVMSLNAKEVQFLAEVARNYSIPLVPLGAETASGTVEEGSLLVRFDLMRRTRFPEGNEPWIEAEPGTVWLKMEDELRARGRGLAVYPTSAPRATVGGWLATNGLGVGSFEYGWLSENVLSAVVVLPGGELREVPGEDLHTYINSGRTNAIVVGARLRTRAADTDTPFAVSFDNPDALVEAVTDAIGSNIPLWHLAFLNPVMARTAGSGKTTSCSEPTREKDPGRWKRASIVWRKTTEATSSLPTGRTGSGQRGSFR